MQDGWTPLALACDKGHSKVVKILLDYSANVNLKNDVSETEIKNFRISGSSLLVTIDVHDYFIPIMYIIN